MCINALFYWVRQPSGCQRCREVESNSTFSTWNEDVKTMTMAPTARSSSTIDSTLTTSRINISTRSSRSNYVIPMGGLLRTVSLTDKRVVVLGFILLSLLTYWIPLVYKGTELGEDAYFKNSELIMKSITKLFTRIDKRSVSVNGSKTVSDINQNQYSSVTSDLESIYGDEFTVHECEKSLYKEVRELWSKSLM